jgi:hypothetical protein
MFYIKKEGKKEREIYMYVCVCILLSVYCQSLSHRFDDSRIPYDII